MNEYVEEINKKLERYGKSLDGKPHFRLVYSDDIYETRVGRFSRFSGPIYLGEFVGAKKVKKYNYYTNRWLLEMWKIEHCKPSNEMPEPDGYECIYAFEDKNNNPLPIKWEAIELIIFCILNPQMDSAQIKAAIEAAHLKEVAEEQSYFEDMLADDSNYFLHKLHHGETILLPGKDF